MKTRLFYIILVLLAISSFHANAQSNLKVVAGQIFLGDGTLAPNKKKYTGFTDSLDKKLKLNPDDTASLFYRALLYMTYNGVIANPNFKDQSGIQNLLIAKNMAEKAISLKMSDFKLKILRAQIYKELAERYMFDESWMFNNNQVAARRDLFNTYKEQSNKFYGELAIVDKRDAYDYERLKVKGNYPIK